MMDLQEIARLHIISLINEASDRMQDNIAKAVRSTNEADYQTHLDKAIKEVSDIGDWQMFLN
jgi:hypothetical protein